MTENNIRFDQRPNGFCLPTSSPLEKALCTLASLQLPPDQAVIVSSTAMKLHGIERDPHDVDVVVSQTVFDYLGRVLKPDRANFFPRYTIVKEGSLSIEIFPTNGPFSGKANRDLFKGAHPYPYGNGLVVATLDDVARIKEGMGPEFGRIQDKRDVDTIIEFNRNRN
ncbi:MAG TPA: hypothetical protein VNW29_07920 [Candidatus Sulfotelmatobacter sp.]|jgi:hypothetical protein|nr:hypothetical protein [Candidatus Sulfotelmatobacter sp.]